MTATHIPHISHLNRRAISAALLGLFAGSPALAQKPTLITDPRTRGPWAVMRWGDATATGTNPWLPNAWVLPDPLFNGYTQAGVGNPSERWNVHPRMREKMRRMLDAFRSAEPAPLFANGHAIVRGGIGEPKGAILERFYLWLGYKVWLYDAAGKIVENKVRLGEFGANSWGVVQVNGQSTPVLADRAFPMIEGLSQGKDATDPLPLGEIRLVRPVRESGPSVTTDDRKGAAGTPAAEAAPFPKGLNAPAFITMSPRPLFGGKHQAHRIETDYCIMLTPEGRLPVHNTLSQAELLGILELKAKQKVQETLDHHAKEPLPELPNRRAGEIQNRANVLRRWENAVKVVDRLRQVFAASLNTEAVVNLRYYNTISGGVPFVLSDEEYPTRVKSSREFPLEGLFIQNPSEGYRFARVNTPYFANLKPGEIRSIQINFKLTHRLPNMPGHGQAEPAGDYTDWGDVPGNFHHSLIHNFNWEALTALLGE